MPTFLRRGFFWRQFRAGSLWRLLLIFPAILIQAIAVLRYEIFDGPTWQLLFFVVIFTVLALNILIPNPGIFRTYGMNSARVRRYTWPVALAVLGVQNIPLFLVRPDWLSFSALVLSGLVAWAWVSSAAPGSETESPISGPRAIAGSKNLAIQLWWRPYLIAGLCLGACSALAFTFLTPGNFLVTVPFFIHLIMPVMMQQRTVAAQALGWTRKKVIAHISGASLLGIGSYVALSALPFLFDATVYPPSVLLLQGCGLVAGALWGNALAGAHWLLVYLGVMLIWQLVRDPVWDPFDYGVMAACGLVGIVVVLFYLAGVINPRKIKL